MTRIQHGENVPPPPLPILPSHPHILFTPVGLQKIEKELITLVRELKAAGDASEVANRDAQSAIGSAAAAKADASRANRYVDNEAYSFALLHF